MRDAYVGEIRMFGGGFAPAGWVPCDGRELPIDNAHRALYDVVGTRYGGGDGRFVVPDLWDAGGVGQAAVRYFIAVEGVPP